LAPEFADVFMKDAYVMAHSREIIGVHYPSDSETSRLFAHKFVTALFQNEKFKLELLAAQREWKEKGFEIFSEKEKH
jgi:acid phosphatase (class A)